MINTSSTRISPLICGSLASVTDSGFGADVFAHSGQYARYVLEYHQRPRNIKVNHFVAKVIRLIPSDATSEQTRRRNGDCVYQRLLRFPSIPYRPDRRAAGDLVIFQFQIRSQLLFEELHVLMLSVKITRRSSVLLAFQGGLFGWCRAATGIC